MKNQLLILISIVLLISCGKDDLCVEEDPARCHTYSLPTCEELYEIYDPIINELKNNIYPISGSSPDLPKVELSPLDEVIGESQFVGLGEATHGTLEFFEMKDRIFRYLVTEHGFKAIGFEATWGGSLFVNEYVLHGTGSAREAISKLQFWTWDTEEVLALVEWMRTYNEGLEDIEKIHFYGFDVQSGIEELYWLEVFLEPINAQLKQEVSDLLEPFIEIAEFSSYADLSVSQQRLYTQAISSARTIYQDHEEEIVAATGKRQFDLYGYAFEVLLMYQDILDGEDGNSRDYYMAINSQWIAEYLGNSAKVALWAHNGHISKKYAYKSQGEFLNELEGDNYKNIGFSFAKGKFQALNIDRILTTSNEISEIECNSAVGVFDAMEEDDFYIIIDDLISNDILEEYFSAKQKYINIGSLYIGDLQSYLYPDNVTNSFDVLIHFTNTKAAKPL